MHNMIVTSRAWAGNEIPTFAITVTNVRNDAWCNTASRVTTAPASPAAAPATV